MKQYKLKRTKIAIIGKISRIKKPNISHIIFSICILFFMLSLLTTAFQRTPIYNIFNKSLELPYELQLYGNITSEEVTVIYIGGYKYRVDSNGTYCLDFITDSKTSILVCLLDMHGDIVFNSIISYAPNEWSKELNINLEKEK